MWSGLELDKQGLLDDHQVGQGEQGVQLRGILGQAAVAQLTPAGLSAML